MADLNDKILWIRIYNVLGMQVIQLKFNKKGKIIKAFWNGKNDSGITQSAGIYTVHVESEGQSLSLNLLLLK